MNWKAVWAWKLAPGNFWKAPWAAPIQPRPSFSTNCPLLLFHKVGTDCLQTLLRTTDVSLPAEAAVTSLSVTIHTPGRNNLQGIMLTCGPGQDATKRRRQKHMVQISPFLCWCSVYCGGSIKGWRRERIPRQGELLLAAPFTLHPSVTEQAHGPSFIKC